MENRQNLYIIGAGGFGREIESWLSLVPKSEQNWNIIGFLDDNLNALDNYPSDYKIINKILNHNFQDNDIAILTISNTKIKESIYNNLKDKVKFMTFISPSAIVAKFTKISEGCIICPNSIIATNTSLGKFTTVNNGTHIGHDSIIGDFCSFMANVDIGGNCKIENHCFIGSNATIIPKRKINSNITIGSGSIVIRNIKSGTVFGNPAKKIK